MQKLGRKYPFLLLSLSSIVLTLLVGCSSDVIVTNPGNDLRFSTDTLSFDTLFSTVGSTTSWLKIRNVGNKTLRIAQISLSSGGTSGFRINLDGESNTSFTNVEIPPHDSLFLFVEVTTSMQGSASPTLVHDAILFNTDAPIRRIVLEAWSWDATFWDATYIQADTTLTADYPIVILDSLVVAENTTLTLLPGTKLYFHDGAFMKVYGTLSAIGTKEAPIQMRGDRLDNVLTDLPYDYYPGQWYYLQLASTSFNNRLEFVDIHGAYYGIIADSSSVSQSKLKMFNSVIHNMVYSCLWSNTSDIEVGNCQLSNSASYTVALIGGSAAFTHCTIANYQHLPFLNRDDGPSLILVNFLADSKDTSIIRAYPMTAQFNNCIVFGSQQEEIGLGKRDNIAWDVTFRNSLLRSYSIPLTQASVINCKYATDAKFLKYGYESDNYVFDYRIDSLSPAKDLGSTAYLIAYPNDLNGISRTTDDTPDAGAYEWVQGQK